MSKDDRLRRLKTLNDAVRAADPELAKAQIETNEGPSPATAAVGDAIDVDISEESIVMRQFRPVLEIKDNETVLTFNDASDDKLWRQRLTKAAPLLTPAIRAVGRVDLSGAPYPWVGTGWLVAGDVVVTNRHVADLFVASGGRGLTFKPGEGGPIGASLDFLQEMSSDRQLVFRLTRPLHVENVGGPDVAFFEIEVVSGDDKLAQPIILAKSPALTNNAAVIGYPAYDNRIPDLDLMQSLYGKVYDKKRLAPGGVVKMDDLRIEHNCTTLGGNSGSTLIDLDSGEALGLHFSGAFLRANYAVRSDVVAKILEEVRTAVPRTTTNPPPAPETRANATNAPPSPRSVSLTVPITITVSVGGPTGLFPTSAVPYPDSGPYGTDADTDTDTASEAPAEDYADRRGYQPSFLGPKNAVPLPSVTRDVHDVLDLDDGSGSELRYEHFSVLMSRKRRMCFLSAVNIDGGSPRKSARVAWKWDPRIPRSQQIMNECYGNPPKFSRGHMTRREDPGWGDAIAAKRGNEDSMHVTNTTPQMQAFNAPIWLALEDHALRHAREDDMKISVFTGPYFRRNDPVMYGVKIPLSFWKVIAFIHDETGKLCATGYEMTQKSNLQEEEYVFGAFTSPQLQKAVQVPIASIEAKSGTLFGRLAGLDPLGGEEEAVGAGGIELDQIEQIRFF